MELRTRTLPAATIAVIAWKGLGALGSDNLGTPPAGSRHILTAPSIVQTTIPYLPKPAAGYNLCELQVRIESFHMASGAKLKVVWGNADCQGLR